MSGRGRESMVRMRSEDGPGGEWHRRQKASRNWRSRGLFPEADPVESRVQARGIGVHPQEEREGEKGTQPVLLDEVRQALERREGDFRVRVCGLILGIATDDCFLWRGPCLTDASYSH